MTFPSPSACDSALDYQSLSKLDDRRWSYDIISISWDGGHNVAKIYSPFPVWWRLTFLNVKSNSHTKFGPDNSIHGWDITTSGFWKRPAAKLKFLVWFRFWSFHCHCGSASVCQISSESNHRHQSYDVIWRSCLPSVHSVTFCYHIFISSSKQRCNYNTGNKILK